MGKVALYNVAVQLISNIALKRFVTDLLMKHNDSFSCFITESEPLEVTYGIITICFSWDFVTVVNCVTNKVVDCTSSIEEVKDFIYSYYLEK